MVFTIGLLTSQCQSFFRVFFFYKAKALRTKQVGFTYPVCLTLTSAKACIIVFQWPFYSISEGGGGGNGGDGDGDGDGDGGGGGTSK